MGINIFLLLDTNIKFVFFSEIYSAFIIIKIKAFNPYLKIKYCLLIVNSIKGSYN